MARTYNKIELLGRVGTDPEMRYTPKGTPMTYLRLATDHRKADGEFEPDWHQVRFWAGSWPKQLTATSRRARG